MSNAILVLFSIFAMASSLSACNSQSSEPDSPENCWKPFIVDTVPCPQPEPNDTILCQENTPITAQTGPVWSTSGEFVSYFSYYDSCNDRDPGIYITGAEGGSSRRKIPVFGAYSQWLPGDTQLIVNTGFGGGGELVMYDINTDSVTPLGIQTRFPTFDVSRDGRYIYYEGEPVPGHMSASIFEYDRQTETEWAVVAGASPAVSPDGQMLAYWDGTFHILRFQDSSITTLSNGGWADWTPDSRNIVFADGLGKLFVTDLADNTRFLAGEHTPSGAYGPISLSPDGTTVLYRTVSDDFAEHIWGIPLEGGTASQFSK